MGIAAIMSIFCLCMGVGTITPALNTIMQAFPDLPISTIYLASTLPSLTVIPATIVAGMLAGDKAKYKTLAIIGIVIFILGGVAPYFSDNFTVILIERAVFGIGLGIISPLGNALILLDDVQTSGRSNLDRLLTAMQQIDKVRRTLLSMKEESANENHDEQRQNA